MLDQGEISRTEYEVIKTELLEAPADEWNQDDAIWMTCQKPQPVRPQSQGQRGRHGRRWLA